MAHDLYSYRQIINRGLINETNKCNYKTIQA